jgi:hypothetical protein
MRSMEMCLRFSVVRSCCCWHPNFQNHGVVKLFVMKPRPQPTIPWNSNVTCTTCTCTTCCSPPLCVTDAQKCKGQSWAEVAGNITRSPTVANSFLRKGKGLQLGPPQSSCQSSSRTRPCPWLCGGVPQTHVRRDLWQETETSKHLESYHSPTPTLSSNSTLLPRQALSEGGR